jgi:hypothetical protein
MERTPGSGRKPGVRNRIAHKFLEDLQAEWERSGADCLKIMAKEDPGGLAKIVAGLLPREFSDEFPTQITIVTGVVRHGEIAPIVAQVPATPQPAHEGDDV